MDAFKYGMGLGDEIKVTKTPKDKITTICLPRGTCFDKTLVSDLPSFVYISESTDIIGVVF